MGLSCADKADEVVDSRLEVMLIEGTIQRSRDAVRSCSCVFDHVRGRYLYAMFNSASIQRRFGSILRMRTLRWRSAFSACSTFQTCTIWFVAL